MLSKPHKIRHFEKLDKMLSSVYLIPLADINVLLLVKKKKAILKVLI